MLARLSGMAMMAFGFLLVGQMLIQYKKAEVDQWWTN